MSESLIAVLAILAVLLLLGLGAIVVALRAISARAAQPKADDSDEEDAAEDDDADDDSFSMEPQFVEQARPFDPMNPPSVRFYNPRPNAPGRSCSCHPERTLLPGQQVVLWPVPNTDPQEVEIWCQAGIKAPEGVSE